MSFRSHGVTVGVRSTDPAILEEARGHLPLGARPSDREVVDVLYSLVGGGAGQRRGVRRYHLAFAGGSRLARSATAEPMLQAFAEHAELVVAALSPQRVFVHAGVVARGDAAILLPGPSGAGKTTLVTALVRAGCRYYSDEFAVLDRKGRVHPYPRPLGVREQPGGETRPVAIGSIGGETGQKPVPVALVVDTEYHPGSRHRFRRVTRGEAVIAMMRHTVSARVRPELAMQALDLVASRSVTLKGRRGEAGVAADRLLRELDAMRAQSKSRRVA